MGPSELLAPWGLPLTKQVGWGAHATKLRCSGRGTHSLPQYQRSLQRAQRWRSGCPDSFPFPHFAHSASLAALADMAGARRLPVQRGVQRVSGQSQCVSGQWFYLKILCEYFCLTINVLCKTQVD